MMMTDPAELFRNADSVGAPDLWKDIVGRTPGQPPREPIGQRVAVAALALLVALVGVGFGLSRYLSSVHEPATQRSHPPSPVAVQIPVRAHHPLSVRDLGKVGTRGQVNDVFWAFGNPWVSSYDEKGSLLVRIDPTTGKPTGEVRFGHGARLSEDWEWGGGALAVAGDSIWAGGARGPYRASRARLFRIDPLTARIAGTYQLYGRAVVDVAFDGQSLWALVSPMRQGSDYEVDRVDPATGSTIARYPYSAAWTRSVLVAADSVWVSERTVHAPNVEGAYIHQLVPGTAQDVTIGGSFAEPASSGDAIWLPGGGPMNYQNTADTLVEVAPASGDVLAKWRVGGIGYDMEATPRSVWFFGQGVEMLDTSSGRLSVGHLDGTPIALAVGTGGAWVVTYDGHLYFAGIRSAGR